MKRRLTAALLSGLLLLAAGCSGGQAPAGSPSPSDPTPAPSSGPSVHTDWSALTPYQPFEPVGGRWYEERTDTLIPRNDYGPLVPYQGPALTYTLPWDEEDQPYDQFLYGLATLDGRIVTDPAYMYIYPVTTFDYASGLLTDLPMWELTRVLDLGDGPQSYVAFAALDGSWVTDTVYASPSEGLGLSGGSDGIFLYKPSAGRCVLLGTDGTERISFGPDTPNLPDNEWWYYELLSRLSANEGFVCRQDRDQNYDPCGAVFYDLSTGTALSTPAITQALAFSCGRAAARDAATGLWGYLGTDGSWAIPPSFDEADSFSQDTAIVYRDGYYHLIGRDGSVLCDFDAGAQVYRDGDYVRVVTINDDNCYWLDSQLNKIPGVVDGAQVGTADSPEGRVFYYPAGDETVLLYNGREYRLPQADWVEGVVDGTVLLQRSGASETDPSVYLLTDLSGRELSRSEGHSLYLISDQLDRNSRSICSYREDSYSILSASGETLFTSEQWPQSFHGLFQVTDQFSTGLRDSEGNWVLRLPRFDNLDD